MLFPNIFAQLSVNSEQEVQRLCMESGAVGALFAEDIRTSDPAAQQRREAFRELVLTDTELPRNPRQSFGDFVTQELRHQLIDVLLPHGHFLDIDASKVVGRRY